jgi:hypothetical protein
MVQALVQTELELFVSPLEFNELEDFALLPPADEFTLELDFTELLDLAEDFPPVEDFTELPEELSPLEAGASSDFAELEGRSPTASGKTDEESSPQAVRLIVAIRARMGREKNFMSRGG